MKVIKNTDALKGKNSDNCEVTEYSFGDKDIDIGIAKITGRYPKDGYYCVNTISKELIYVIEGSGKIYFEKSEVTFNKGDSILIDSNEKYYWESEYCLVSMSCTPAWDIKQYKEIK